MKRNLAASVQPLRPSSMGDVNAGTVLDVIRHQQFISRADIARQTMLSPTAVSNIVADLVARNLVHEELASTTSLGRRSILLHFNPDAGQAIGVDLDRDYLHVGITNLAGKLIACRGIVLHETAHLHDVLNGIGSLITELYKIQGIIPSAIIGMGLGAPSAIAYAEGVLHQPALPNLREAPLKRLLEERFGFPVHVENDAKAAALAEYRLHAGSGNGNLIYLKVGEGIGIGLVLNGNLYRGSRGVAGNIGHVRIPGGSIPCNCGSIGCLEAEAGGKALLQQARHLLLKRKSKVPDHEPNLNDIVASVKEGNEEMIRLVASSGRKIGDVLAVVIRTMDVDQIIVGGTLSRCGDVLLTPLRMATSLEPNARNEVDPTETDDPPVMLTRLAGDPGVVAAASLALDAFFESPR